jgi:hypothetical protein
MWLHTALHGRQKSQQQQEQKVCQLLQRLTLLEEQQLRLGKQSSTARQQQQQAYPQLATGTATVPRQVRLQHLLMSQYSRVLALEAVLLLQLLVNLLHHLASWQQ